MKISGDQPKISSGASAKRPSPKMSLLSLGGGAKSSGAVMAKAPHKGTKIDVTA